MKCDLPATVSGLYCKFPIFLRGGGGWRGARGQLEEELLRSATASGLLARYTSLHHLYLQMPAALTFIICLAAAIALYIGCCCCPKQCNTCCKIRNNDDDIVTRVEKLEHFFTFYVNDRFHELQCKDLLEATKKQT